MPGPRRGASALFVVGCVLWASVFAGLFYLRYSRTAGEETDPRDKPGVIPIAEPEPGPKTLEPKPKSEKVTYTDADGNPLPNGWSPDGIEDFELTERSGRTVTKQDLLGKPWVIGFVFTRCQGPCPRVSKAMHDIQQATKDRDMRLVTLTVDPEHDTPEVLTRYADLYIADEDRWLYLTGDEEDVYDLIGRSFKMPVKQVPAPPGGDAEYDVIHTSNLLFVDAEGVVRGKYNSMDAAETGRLLAKIRKEVPRVEGQTDAESDADEATDSDE